MATEDLKTALLEVLAAVGSSDSLWLAQRLQQPHEAVVGCIKSILGYKGPGGLTLNIITAEQHTKEAWQLTDEGAALAEHGSYEIRVLNLIPEAGISREELNAKPEFVVLENGAVGINNATKLGWIKPVKEGGAVRFVRTPEAANAVDTLKAQLTSIRDHPHGEAWGAEKEQLLKDLKKRKLADKRSVAYYAVSRGSDFTTNLVKPESDLTEDMLLDGSWKGKAFKTFNLECLGTPVTCGTLHPLLKVREEYRQIFLEMGFEEMPTSRFVESSFWNFDALFQPQQHPARDAHDTFFMSDPAVSTDFPPDYVKRVQDVHENGGYGSQGYRYKWELGEAQKNILRTHTTAISARMLYKLSQQKPFKPVKYFSIDRVFRNESLDATHLAEFHQIEGVIADYNLTLGDLMGTLANFFQRLGIGSLRFKPAYNPYTEPSMEIFAYHPVLNKIVEIGNSGVFRPEMLLPMGLPEDVVVIAWGLGLERPTMIKYGYKNIRDLFGHKVDLLAAKDKPIVRI